MPPLSTEIEVFLQSLIELMSNLNMGNKMVLDKTIVAPQLWSNTHFMEQL